MIIDKLKKDQVKFIADRMSKNLLKFPLFMFFCKDMSKREGFIKDYFRYYLPEWSKNEILIMNDEINSVVTLTDPTKYEYKFKGIDAIRMKRHEFSSYVFVYQENTEMVCDILLPYTKPAKVMNVYAGSDMDFSQVEDLVDEAIKYADENNTTLVFDTFSRRYIESMGQKGFSVAYQKQFINTQFVDTIMIYNM